MVHDWAYMSLKEVSTSFGDTLWMEEDDRQITQQRLLEWEKKLEEMKIQLRAQQSPSILELEWEDLQCF